MKNTLFKQYNDESDRCDSHDPEGWELIEKATAYIESLEKEQGRKLSWRERGDVWVLFGILDPPEHEPHASVLV